MTTSSTSSTSSVCTFSYEVVPVLFPAKTRNHGFLFLEKLCMGVVKNYLNGKLSKKELEAFFDMRISMCNHSNEYVNIGIIRQFQDIAEFLGNTPPYGDFLPKEVFDAARALAHQYSHEWGSNPGIMYMVEMGIDLSLDMIHDFCMKIPWQWHGITYPNWDGHASRHTTGSGRLSWCITPEGVEFEISRPEGVCLKYSTLTKELRGTHVPTGWRHIDALNEALRAVGDSIPDEKAAYYTCTSQVENETVSPERFMATKLYGRYEGEVLPELDKFEWLSIEYGYTDGLV